jgi:hypothetical protein
VLCGEEDGSERTPIACSSGTRRSASAPRITNLKAELELASLQTGVA